MAGSGVDSIVFSTVCFTWDIQQWRAVVSIPLFQRCAAVEVANKQWISGRGAESNKPNGPAIAATSKQEREGGPVDLIFLIEKNISRKKQDQD